jgi:hypothetical protein
MAEKKVAVAPAAQAPAPAPAAPAPTGKSNGMAVTGLVLGIIAVLLMWSIWPPIIVGVLAIIFGAVGLNAAKTTGVGHGMAMAGLILGIIAVALALLWFFVIAAWMAAIFGGLIGGTGLEGIQNTVETLSQWTPGGSY